MHTDFFLNQTSTLHRPYLGLHSCEKICNHFDDRFGNRGRGWRMYQLFRYGYDSPDCGGPPGSGGPPSSGSPPGGKGQPRIDLINHLVLKDPWVKVGP